VGVYRYVVLLSMATCVSIEVPYMLIFYGLCVGRNLVSLLVVGAYVLVFIAVYWFSC
jgi:hypothetical protein